jgi:Cu/Ag efflux protein CusF
MIDHIRMMMLAVLAGAILSWTPSSTMAEEPVWTKGTIRKVDPSQGKVTIRHGEIKNLDMPPMTMIFRVSNPKMLEGLKPKQRVEFFVVDEKGRMVIKKFKSQ